MQTPRTATALFGSLSLALGTLVGTAGPAAAQPDIAPQNDAPNPYATIADWAKLPDGREWGSHGSGPGQFRTPHAIDLDSRGRAVVADRGNDRLQVFDPDGTFIEEFHQYSRPSGLHIADDDTVRVADSASSRNGQHPGWEYGIRIGNLRDGSLDWFIDGSNPEGVTVAADGTVYGAVVAFGGALLKYVRPDVPRDER